jgi:hypothetical protein
MFTSSILTLKMTATMFAETLEDQQMTQLEYEIRSDALDMAAET